MKRYQDARKDGAISGCECSSVSDAFKRVADDNPGLLEARFNQGAVLYECGREDEAARIWEGLQVRPRDHQPRLHRLEEQRHRPRRVAVHAARSRTIRCTASRRATTSRRSCATRPARPASREEKKRYVGEAVSNLRTVLALDSNNLQAFSTLAFIYYDMNMLEMAKLVGNQAIKKAEEIATGKFEEEKVEEAVGGQGRQGGKKGKKAKAARRRPTRATTAASGQGGRRPRGRHRRHRRHEEAARGRLQHAGPRRAQEEEHQPRHQAVQEGGRR